MCPNPPVKEPESFGFDTQAANFDRRAGIPPRAADQIATAVEELVTGDLLLDIGAGTGEIGASLPDERAPDAKTRGRLKYVGLDLSLPMLTIYRHKLDAGDRRLLLQANADRKWPIASATVKTLFLSRAAHLLHPAHLVSEATRVAHPGGATLLIGRVRRDRSSLRAEMRRQLHRLLAEHGVEGRGGDRSRKRLATAFEQRGTRVSSPRTVASWPVVERPADSLAAWRDKPGLAGRTLSAQVHRHVLQRLERWARERFGELGNSHRGREHYTLTTFHIKPNS